MREQRTLGSWLKGFFFQYLPCDRGLSINTQRSYRDCLKLFLRFVSEETGNPVDRLDIEDLTKARVTNFLRHLANHRGCSPQTRNQRLAAIRALARYVAANDPAYVDWWGQLRAMELANANEPDIDPLTLEEMNAMLKVPDRTKPLGRTEHALLLFLLNIASRVSEAARLTVGNLEFHSSPEHKSVAKFRVKGGKTVRIPMWKKTESALAELVAGRAPSDPVFLSSHGKAFTRSGIYRLVKRAAAKVPALSKKKVTPHVLRHTAACLLLQSGVDLLTISHWLGHKSVETTKRYLKIDFKKKKEAAERSDVLDPGEQPEWKQQSGVMELLDSM